ncbi:hypothetical protein [Tamilnaduibacter salinus]|uniref:hypothetical protein n=1 Tax=Tamilnaduibacter salinus TaxID=1484056 RepID=UPI00117F0129|nr:hypothetical protein [Tamilnaduibacter salinus]
MPERWLYGLLSDDDLQDIEDGSVSGEHLEAFARQRIRDGFGPVGEHQPRSMPARHRPASWKEYQAGWSEAFDTFTHHHTGCDYCTPERGRYCRTGWRLKRYYESVV